MSGRINHTSGRINHTSGKINHTSGRINRTSGRINHASGRINCTSGKINHASGRLNCMSGRINCTSGRINCTSGKINRTSGRINRTSGRLNHASGKINHTSGKINYASGKLNHASGRINRMSGKINRMSGRINCTSGRLNHASGRINRMSGRINCTSGRLNCMSGRLNHASGKLNHTSVLKRSVPQEKFVPEKFVHQRGLSPFHIQLKKFMACFNIYFVSKQNEILAIDHEPHSTLHVQSEPLLNRNHGRFFSLSGRLDLFNAELFQQRCFEAVNNGDTVLIFQCSELYMIDSLGAFACLTILNAAQKRGGTIIFLNIQTKVRNILHVFGILEQFQYASSLEEALKKCSVNNAPISIICPVCSKKMKISKPGYFRCPSCKKLLSLDNNKEIVILS
ncbi:hypothetical protein PilKf_02091 [Pillotina sp. SPG140]